MNPDAPQPPQDLRIPPPPSLPASAPKQGSTSKSKFMLIIIAAAITTVGLLGATVWGMQQRSRAERADIALQGLKQENRRLSLDLAEYEKTSEGNQIDNANYQAVFLDNEQVYFGKMTALDESRIVLEDIYYLRTAATNGSLDTSTLEGDVSLVKLGSELHGPQDKMYIDRTDVTFWENLKPDSQVSKAIKDYRRSNPKE